MIQITTEVKERAFLTVEDLRPGEAYRIAVAPDRLQELEGLVVIGSAAVPLHGWFPSDEGSLVYTAAVGLDGTLWHTNDTDALFVPVDLDVVIRETA